VYLAADLALKSATAASLLVKALPEVFAALYAALSTADFGAAGDVVVLFDPHAPLVDGFDTDGAGVDLLPQPLLLVEEDLNELDLLLLLLLNPPLGGLASQYDTHTIINKRARNFFIT
jgi:hypothetical protein